MLPNEEKMELFLNCHNSQISVQYFISVTAIHKCRIIRGNMYQIIIVMYNLYSFEFKLLYLEIEDV